VMVEDTGKIEDREWRRIQVEDEALDMLLFQFLQELIFYKDAEKLLLRVAAVEIIKEKESFRLSAEAFGEELDPVRHELNVDVKAVTLYRLSVEETKGGWKATVILDI
jgi:SHS2 domain-containing protein